MKFKEWTDLYLQHYVQPTSKARTYQQYKYVLTHHVAPYIGEKEMEEITPTELQSVVSRLLRVGNTQTGNGLSTSTVNTAVTVLQGTFDTAKRAGASEDDPAAELRRPRVKQAQIDCFSEEEQAAIEEEATRSKTKMLGVILCLYTGLRIGELLALEWSDVDFLKNMLYVNKNCRDGRNGEGRVVDTPKTEKSRREIPLPETLVVLLWGMRQRSYGKWVVSDHGEPVSIRSYQRSFQLLLKRAGVRHRGFHALRHTFATRAVECGMDVKTLSEILGHKNPTVTLGLYVHSLMDHKSEMMKKLAGGLDIVRYVK